MDLERLGAVEEGAACLLHPLGPANVVLLVEPSPQFHEYGDILAVLRGGGQIFSQFGSGGQTVDSDFDGGYLGVKGSFPNQVEKGVHLLEGIEKKDVPFQYLGQDGSLGVQAGGKARGEGRVTQGGRAFSRQEGGQGIGILQADGTAGLKDLIPV